VTFAAVGLPSNLTASFQPSTLPAGGGPTAVQMTVTSAQASSVAAPVLPVVPSAAAMVLLAALAAVTGLRERPRLRLGGLLAAIAILLLISFGSVVNAAPVTGTFPFTVTATSGTSSVSQLFTVTVQ
jgi:hypothetical protein